MVMRRLCEEELFDGEFVFAMLVVFCFDTTEISFSFSREKKRME
jgi:hypothetical protein